jgi:RND family efflux transporter MFP subunit
MDDKTKLLESLQIHREPEAPAASNAGWWVAGAMGIALLAVVGWTWMNSGKSSESAEISTVANTSASSVSATAPASAATLDASGYVVARRQAVVSPSGQLGGKVVEMLIKEGSRVKQGDVLARLDDRSVRLSLSQAKAGLDNANAQLRAQQVTLQNAEPTYQRVKKQQAAGYLSSQALDDAKANYDAALSGFNVQQEAVKVAQANVAIAEHNLAETVIRAPFDGVITAKNADVGEFVMVGAAGGTRTGIGTIVDMDSLEVEVDVSENYINRVKSGQAATVKLNAYPDWEIPAKVIAIIPTADRAKATVKVRIGFEQRDDRILPDMGAHVSFFGG